MTTRPLFRPLFGRKSAEAYPFADAAATGNPGSPPGPRGIAHLRRPRNRPGPAGTGEPRRRPSASPSPPRAAKIDLGASTFDPTSTAAARA